MFASTTFFARVKYLLCFPSQYITETGKPKSILTAEATNVTPTLDASFLGYDKGITPCLVNFKWLRTCEVSARIENYMFPKISQIFTYAFPFPKKFPFIGTPSKFKIASVIFS